MKHLADLRDFFKNNSWLLISELILLSLMIASLPSLEAPKNIFLVFFVAVATIRQIKAPQLHCWGLWDWIFSGFICCALLSAIFAGYAPGNEWGGFRMLLTYSSVGWLVSRSNYSNKQISWLFLITIISTIPPLIWGLIQYLLLHTKPDLQLHSVGHVNHSAIYLTMIWGATVGLTVSIWEKTNFLIRTSLALLSILLFLSLVIGESRGAFGIGLLLALIIILVSCKEKKLKWLFLSLLAVGILFTIISGSKIIEKQIARQNTGQVLALRDKIWNVPLEVSRLYPIFGIGMNNWKFINIEDIKKSVEKRNEVFNQENYILSFGHAHNLYLQALLERGILGLISIIILLIMWLRELILSLNQRYFCVENSYLWSGAFAAWLSTFGIGFVNSTLHHEHGILALLLLALFLCKRKNLNISAI